MKTLTTWWSIGLCWRWVKINATIPTTDLETIILDINSDWSDTNTNSAYYLLEYRFLDNFSNVSEYSSPVTIPIISSDSRNPISITSLAGYSGLGTITGIAPNKNSPRTGSSSFIMQSGKYAASNVTRTSTGSDSLTYSWQPVSSGSNYSYDVYLSWRTGGSPPILSTTATMDNADVATGNYASTATLYNLDPDAASQFIVGQYIVGEGSVGGGAPSSLGTSCYVSAINLSENSIDVVFPNSDAFYNNSIANFTNIKSKTSTWLPFQFAGTTKANSFSFQIKDIETGGTAISDVQFVQALVSLSTYPKYQNDYMSWQTIWSISPAFSTWQTPSASLGASTNSSGGAHTSILTINTTGGVVANTYPTNAQMSENTNARIVGLSGSTKVVFTVTERTSGTSLIVRTSSAIASATALTNLTL